MAEIVAHFTNQGVPLVSPANVPTIRIRRTDTGALVETDSVMNELGDGGYVFSFTPVSGLDYSIRADGDPTASGQTGVTERYVFGTLGSHDDVVTAMWDYALEGSFTANDMMTVICAALAGQLSGAATTNVIIRDMSDTKTVIDATVDASGNRTNTTITP